MFHQFNTNFLLSAFLTKKIAESGIELRPIQAYRSKVMGFMGGSGEYVVGDYVVDDHHHYHSYSEPRSWGLRFYKGLDAYHHLLANEAGEVFFSETGFESAQWNPTTQKHELKVPGDLVKTEMTVGS